MTIKDLVKNRKVKFLYFREKELWYEVVDTGFMFPVHADDVGTGIFKAEDKAILFMRWIRKHHEFLEDARKQARLM